MDFEQRRKDNDQLQQLDKVIESTEGTLKRLNDMRREVVNRLGINKECKHDFDLHTDGVPYFKCLKCGALL